MVGLESGGEERKAAQSTRAHSKPELGATMERAEETRAKASS